MGVLRREVWVEAAEARERVGKRGTVCVANLDGLATLRQLDDSVAHAVGEQLADRLAGLGGEARSLIGQFTRDAWLLWTPVLLDPEAVAAALGQPFAISPGEWAVLVWVGVVGPDVRGSIVHRIFNAAELMNEQQQTLPPPRGVPTGIPDGGWRFPIPRFGR